MTARVMAVVLAAFLMTPMSGYSVRFPGINIGDGGGGQPHCPPGQAKTGRY